MIHVVWLPLSKSIPTGPGVYWDTTLLEQLLTDCLWHQRVESLAKLDEAIVIIPGAHAGRHITKINTAINQLKHCKLIITSDEDNKFPIDKIKHPNIEIYANYYHKKYKTSIKWLPIGPAKIPRLPYTEKDLDWFFAGQVNHASRKSLVRTLSKLPNGKLITTKGFAQGISQEDYYSEMARAKAVPAPKGFISPDSFRFYEALELGAVPIPEAPNYWPHLFADVPMPILKTWRDIGKEIDHANDQAFRNECVAWWHRQKLRIKDDLVGPQGFTTVIIPVSPVKSHPYTNIIDETIASVRKQLPDARIIVTFDGVRKEQADKAADYQEFISRFLWKYNNKNIYPIIFKEHTHQVGMAREALKLVKTETILYVEQDTPLTDDVINWEECQYLITEGVYDLIRFHFETAIPLAHQHMMIRLDDRFTTVPYMRTCQWSQRPHLASVGYYDRILRDNFTEGAKSFIEDKMHGVAHNDYLQHGIQGWYNHRLAIYHPDTSIKRSYHTDGRAGEKKYDESQVF